MRAFLLFFHRTRPFRDLPSLLLLQSLYPRLVCWLFLPLFLSGHLLLLRIAHLLKRSLLLPQAYPLQFLLFLPRFPVSLKRHLLPCRFPHPVLYLHPQNFRFFQAPYLLYRFLPSGFPERFLREHRHLKHFCFHRAALLLLHLPFPVLPSHCRKQYIVPFPPPMSSSAGLQIRRSVMPKAALQAPVLPS